MAMYNYDYDDVIKTINGNTSVYDTSVEIEKTELIVSGCSLVFQGSVKGVGIDAAYNNLMDLLHDQAYAVVKDINKALDVVLTEAINNKNTAESSADTFGAGPGPAYSPAPQYTPTAPAAPAPRPQYSGYSSNSSR